MKSRNLFAAFGAVVLVSAPVWAQETGKWEVQNSGVKDDLHAVTFLSDKVGIAVGANKTVLKTADGGKTWKRVVESEKGVSLNQVSFATAKLGWATSSDGYVFHTANGGDTWKPIKGPDLGFGAHLFTHAAVGSTFYLLVWSGLHDPLLYQISDDGKNWTTLTRKLPMSGYGDSTRMVFTDQKHGYFVYGGKVGRTEDGGKTWQVQKTADKGNLLDGPRICFVDKDRGWYCWPNGEVNATTDAGKTWTRQEARRGDGFLLDLHFTDAKLGHVLSGEAKAKTDIKGEVRRTTDAGKSWVSLGKLDAPDRTRLNGLSFPSSSHGWVVGDKGYIAHYHSK